MRRRMMVGGLAGFLGTLAARSHSPVAQRATPLPIALPEATAPFGLSGLGIPGTPAEVSAHFAALPRIVHGLPRNPMAQVSSARTRVTYGLLDPTFGATLVIQAIDLRESDFFPPDFTPGRYVAAAAASDDSGATSFGQDHGTAWIQAETFAATQGEKPGTPEAARPLHTLAWGVSNGSWLFTAAATTPEGLAALVAAYVTGLDRGEGGV